MLYHVSPVHGIKVLEPRVSTHGKAYVYAIENSVTALLFGAPKDDFDFMMDEEDGIPVVYECYPGALEVRYKGKNCSVYEVEETGFLRSVTGWEPELVCESAVPVIRETVVTDLYGMLADEADNGNLKLHRYREEMEYKQLIEDHITDRLIRFRSLEHDYINTDMRFKKYYSGLVENVRARITDGVITEE